MLPLNSSKAKKSMMIGMKVLIKILKAADRRLLIF